MNEFTYLDNLSGAYAESRILHAAVELNIFDAIGENRMSVQGISKRLKTNERATELFLNALTALNLLHKKDNLFSLTDLAKEYLVTTSETCYTGMIRFESAMWSVWGELVKAVRTGKPIRAPDVYQTNREETALLTFVLVLRYEFFFFPVGWHWIPVLYYILDNMHKQSLYHIRLVHDLSSL